MIVGILETKLMITASRSLKEKRMVLKSLKDKLHNNFNIAIAETDNLDKWQLGTLSIVTVSSDSKYANSLLCKTIEFIDKISEVELLDYKLEFI